MPAYNADRYILQSIKTVFNQTFQNWELIVIDDGSTDKTRHIVKELQENDERIIYFHQENKKLSAARNSGLEIAKGKYIAFLDSDDLWEPDKLKKQIKVIQNTDVDLVYSDGYILNDETKILHPYPTISGHFNGAQMYQMQFFQNYIPVLSVIFKKEWINIIGKQDEKLIFGCEDWDYWLRMAKNGATFYGMPEKLFKYRVHEGGMSRKITQMKLAEFTALHNNIDYRLLSKEKIYKRLCQLMQENVPQLLKTYLHQFAEEEVKKVLQIKYSFKHQLVYVILSLKLTLFFKYVDYIFYPGKLLIKLKFKKSFVC